MRNFLGGFSGGVLVGVLFILLVICRLKGFRLIAVVAGVRLVLDSTGIGLLLLFSIMVFCAWMVAAGMVTAVFSGTMVVGTKITLSPSAVVTVWTAGSELLLQVIPADDRSVPMVTTCGSGVIMLTMFLW